MSEFVKTMLVWIIIFPILTTTLSIVIDYFRGLSIEVISYLPNLLGFAIGGVLIGFLRYYLQQKSKEEK
ncbi:hypothetical protein GCM10008986_25940 [Salinibacillus aidingensis]|uniref:Uncharacterized protein n=1 Tax=Salinibacillus aidingensis TaxID=237684 RepID=A0ABN1BGW4_9BACI